MDADYLTNMRDGNYQRCYQLAQRVGMDLWFESRFSCSVVVEYVYKFHNYKAKTLEALAELVLKHPNICAADSIPWYNREGMIQGNRIQEENRTARRLVYNLKRIPILDFDGKIIELNHWTSIWGLDGRSKWASGTANDTWIIQTLDQNQLLHFLALLYKKDGIALTPERTQELKDIIEKEFQEIARKAAIQQREDEERRIANAKRSDRQFKREQGQARTQTLKRLRRLLENDDLVEAQALQSEHQQDPYISEIAAKILAAYQQRKVSDQS